ncbi:MAG TPA: YdcF family protein [Flavisolibacter sp.]|nr:YdcF family protein [Flavisolibacter sp.]
MVTPETIRLAKILWNYHHMNQEVQKADCLFVLGSHDTRVAERGASLFLEGWSPLLIFSGGLGRLTKGEWKLPEADLFAQIAIDMGVPPGSILVENRSANTGENILFTKALLEEKNIHPHSFLLVQKPYMERRSYATFEKCWPGQSVRVTSPQLSFEEYITPEFPLDKVINIMVGDLQRIKLYPARGFQVYQEIPAHVWEAYEQLIALGYNKQLVKD